MGKKRSGYCCICGNHGPLSFEHVPPKVAFNIEKVTMAKFDDFIGKAPNEEIKGRFQQGGIGYYSLCQECNNNTGAWYAKHFAEWCYQAIIILRKSNGQPSLAHLYYLFPLPIIKQIATMFFSVNDYPFCKANPELVRFVLEKERRYLSKKYRFFIYFNINTKIRHAGLTVMGNIFKPNLKPILLSEITYPPFGYLMTIDSEPPDKRLIEITNFTTYGYNQFEVVPLQLPVLPTDSYFPGDYRTMEEILKQAAQNG